MPDQPGDDLQKQIDVAKKQKELFDLQQGLKDGQAKAALSQSIGDVKQGPFTGSVTMKDKAGTEEALLLGSVAIRQAAKRIADAVRTSGTTFYVFTDNGPPKFQQLLAYRLRKQLVKNAFAALGIVPPQHAGAPHTEAVAAPAIASAGLDAVSKILGFFKSDYEVGGIDAKTDVAVLLYAVAGSLRTPPAQGAASVVRFPSIFGPTPGPAVTTPIGEDLAMLLQLRTNAAAQAKTLADAAAAADAEAADPAKAATQAASLETSRALKANVDQLNAAAALYDAFMTSLATPDAAGALPLSLVAQQLALEAALNAADARVLLLRLENSGGSYLLKKNIWTALWPWSVPVYHTGGATVAYLLLRGADGEVLMGDTIPVFGGFVRSDKLSAFLDSQP